MGIQQIVCECGCDTFRTYLSDDDTIGMSIITECAKCNKRMVNFIQD